MQGSEAIQQPIDQSMMQTSSFDEDQENNDEYDEETQSEEDEEEDKKQFGIYQCLPVDDLEPDWSTDEPTSVEEYLRRVRHEARQLPSVVTSDIDPRHFDHQRTPIPIYTQSDTITECRDALKPSKEWMHEFMKKFSILRHQLQLEYDQSVGQVPGLPLKIAFNHNAHPTPSQSSSPSPSLCMPELLAIQGLDQIHIVNKLYSTISKILQYNTAQQIVDIKDASLIYALSARIEKPLHSDTCAAYRSLLKKCCEWRGRVVDVHDDLLPHLNVIITLAGAYFGQDEELAKEWCDEYEDDLWQQYYYE